MAKTNVFAETLVRIRKELGFANAHAFFHGREGRKVLGITYVNYVNLEKGKSLPQSRRLRPLLTALGCVEHSPHARELVRAYVVSVLGSDELLPLLVGEASPPATGERKLVARQASARRSYQLTNEQWTVRTKDYATYTCFAVLVNTAGWLTFGELARMARLKPAEVAGAAKALSSAALAEVSGEKIRTPLADMIIQPAPRVSSMLVVAAKAQAYIRRFAEHGELVTRDSYHGRMDEKGRDQFARHLRESLGYMVALSNAENKPGTALYRVEARLLKLC